MAKTQFQIESPRVAGGHKDADRRWSYSTTNETSLQPGLQALLLGLHLRGRLCDREKEFLDLMAPERHLTFLLLGDKYLHPQDFALFPEDVTSGLTALGADAISYRRLRPDGGRESSPLGVHTARIGSCDGEALVLGMAGPDLPLERAGNEQFFAHLVDLARGAERRVAPVADRLLGIVRSQVPAILILRASGRVLAVNRALDMLLKADEGELVDLEWGAVKRRLADLLPSSNIDLESIADGDLSVAVMRLRSRTPKRESKSEFDSFLDAVQHRVSAVATSARHLRGLSCCIPGEINSELVRIIQEEAEELLHSFSCLRVVDSFASLSPQQCDLTAELRGCVGRTLKRQHHRNIVVSRVGEGELACRAPRQAVTALFDALITAHGQGHGEQIATEITLRSRPERDGIAIRFVSHSPAEVNGSASVRNAWLAYADKLSAHLGWSLEHAIGDGAPIISELELTISGAML